jgi:hypothetical protein
MIESAFASTSNACHRLKRFVRLRRKVHSQITNPKAKETRRFSITSDRFTHLATRLVARSKDIKRTAK